MASTPATPARKEELADRLLKSVRGAFDVFTIYLGDQLGYYEALREGGAMTPTELAARASTEERYAREWLEQQTVAGVLEVEDPAASESERRFRLPADAAEILTDRESLDYMAPLFQLLAGCVYPLRAVVDAHRNGGGVPYEDFGRDLREGQGRMNRAAFLQLLGKEWLPSVPDLDARLRAAPPARVADFGCGVGWSAIGMVKAYPDIIVDGFDFDDASIEEAKRNAEEAGVSDRAFFEVRDAGDPSLRGRYDLVTAFECVHDLSNPVGALAVMRRLVKDGGSVLIVDERVGESFTPEGNEVEWLMYGFSVLHCLPAGMAERPSAGTGTVMRPATLKGYARKAGFQNVEVLPIDNFFFRFYRLS